jgi:hypothetical protein
MCDGRIVYRGGSVLDNSVPASVAVTQPRHFWVTLSGLIVPRTVHLCALLTQYRHPLFLLCPQ